MFDDLSKHSDRELLILVHHMVKDVIGEQKEQSRKIETLQVTHVTKEQFAPIALAVNEMQRDRVTKQDFQQLTETVGKKVAVSDFEKFLEKDYVPFKNNTVTKDAVSPIRLIVYGAVGMVLSFFGAGVLSKLFPS